MAKLSPTLVAIMILLNYGVYAQSEELRGTLTLEMTGFGDNLGRAILKLFRKEDKVPSTPYIERAVLIDSNKAVIAIENLPYGDYAAICAHDQNANGYIDHSWGFPSEPLGYSNNWKLSLLSGMPSFDKLRFTFTEKQDSLMIKIPDL